MQNFQRLKAGHPWKVNETTANAILASAEDYQKHARDPGLSGSPSFHVNPNICLIRNDSGGTLARFGIVGLDVPCILPTANLDHFKHQIVFSGVSPSSTNHFGGKFAILLEPLTSGAIGQAVISGAVQIQLNVINAADIYADIDVESYYSSSSTYLQTGLAGSASILCKESGIGTGKWGIVNLGAGQFPWWEATLTAGLNTGGTATATVMVRGLIDTLTVYDHFLATGGSIVTGTRVGIEFDFESKHWVVTEVKGPC